MRNESPDFFGGSALQAELEGSQPAMEDSLAYGHLLDSLPQDQDAVQVAGMGTALGRILGRSSRGVAAAVKGAAPVGSIGAGLSATERQLMDEALLSMRKARQQGAQARRTDLQAQAQGGVPPVPIAEGAPSPRAVHGTSGEINLERHHPGAPAQEYPELVDLAQNDPGKLLHMVRTADEMGDMLDVIGEQLHQAPRTHASIRAQGFDYDAVAQALTQEGLANDRQLFALRTVIATLGDKTARLAREIYQNSNAGGKPRADMLLEYTKTAEQLVAFVSFTKGQTREVARALSQQQMVADVLQGDDLRAIMAALNASTGGDPEALVNSAIALTKQLDMGVDPAIALKGAMERHTPLEAWIEFWKANNLSGFATQGYNMLSAPVMMFYETAARTAAAGIGEARHALGIGSREYYSGGELTASMVAGVNGLYHGLKFFWHTLATGETQLGAYGGKEIGSSAIYEQFSAPGGFLSRFGMGMSPNVSEAVATPAFRVMKAVDEAMMVPGFMAELTGLAYRDGLTKGLSGDALWRHVENLMMDPPYHLQQDALEQGKKIVMQASAEDPRNAGFFIIMGEHLHRLAKAQPYLQFIVPWIKTPARIMDSQVEASVLAAASPRLWRQVMAGGAQGDIALGKIVLGVSVTAALYPLFASMQITGGGPEDPAQRKALEDLGWLPYSFKVGNHYVSYRNWADPVIGLVAGLATAAERARFARLETDIVKEIMTGVGAISEYMLEASYMEGFKRLFDATSTQARLIAYLGGVATGFMPYGGAQASVARMHDQTERARSRTKSPGFGSTGFVDDLFNSVREDFAIRFPGIRDTLRPARYWDGAVKVPEGPDIVKSLLPMPMRELRDDPASRELVKHGVRISEVASRFDFGSKLIQIELLDLDGGKGMIYDELIKQVGFARREAVNIMINRFDYKNTTPAFQGLMLDQAIAFGRQKGEAVFMTETLLPMVERGEVGGLEKSAREANMTLQQFVQLLLARDPSAGRAIVPQSRREIELPPALEFK
jgi:hypothetical protein